MASVNRVILIGNLTRDPEVRATPKGTQIAAFAIAVNRKWKDESGAEKEEVTYVDIEAWGRTAEVIGKYFTKGKPIYVEGRLKLDQWEDKTSKEKRSKMKVVLENFQFLNDGKGPQSGEGGPARQPAAARPAAAQAPGGSAPAVASHQDDDVPF